MVNILVVYDSKYGNSEKYAKMIATALNADILPKKKTSYYIMTRYQIIIYGGGIYMDKINGLNLIIDNYDAIKEKEIIVFSVGTKDPNDKENFIALNKKLSKNKIFDNIKIYNFRGDINYKKLSIVDKTLINLMYKNLTKKPENKLHSFEKEFLEIYNTKTNFVDEKNIKDLVEYVKKVEKRIEDEILNDK